MRKMRLIQICFLVLFIIILLFSIIFTVFLSMPHISMALLIIEFPIAGIIAVYGSLSIREEEEES